MIARVPNSPHPGTVTDPIVELIGLTKHYPGLDRPALDNLSFAIRGGSFFGLLGPNGAGKSTLLSILCGLRAPSGGHARVAGQDVVDEPREVKALLGLVPQDLAIYPALTARENLKFFGRMQGLTGRQLSGRVDACLDLAGLEPVADRRSETYSGGLKRRLNLVVGLIHEPRLLILDEPTVGIDPQSRHFIHESLRRLHANGMSIIYSTHYMEEAEQLCDDVAVIDRGRILAHGSVAEILGGQHNGEIEMHVDRDLEPEYRDAIRSMPHVNRHRIDTRSIWLQSADPERTLADILTMLNRGKIRLSSLNLGSTNLEQVFLRLTGTRLRD